MDISYNCENQKFNYRVCAMIIAENKILAMHDERSPYFYLPGGRVKMGETAEQAVVREDRKSLFSGKADKNIHLSIYQTPAIQKYGYAFLLSE